MWDVEVRAFPPFARKKAKGWGTVDLWMDESGRCALVLSQVSKARPGAPMVHGDDYKIDKSQYYIQLFVRCKGDAVDQFECR
jgi:hypothetical protein